MPLINTLTAPVLGINSLLEKLQSPLLLLFRLWVAKVFFMSGLQKLNTWGDEYGVLYLFREEYNVPFLNYEVAAFLATAGELILPIFLVIGFGTRYIAIALSILNVVAVVSYYATLAKVGQVTPHIFWGAMLLTTIIFGSGYFSIDQWFKNKYCSSASNS
ncbi:MAG: DoxX family protein [Gammaproteobacteria bacterium]|nr:DoxX family protein [Gammaproteobacteria bacterium]